MKLNSLTQNLRDLEKDGDMKAVLQGAEQLMKLFPDNEIAKSNAAAFFIDSGTILRKVSAIERGMEIIQSLLTSALPDETDKNANLKYNLSNGYAAKHELLLYQGKSADADQAIQEAKSILQGLLIEKQNLSTNLHASIMTNYGNLLDKLGRTFEAIDQHLDCINYFPEHAMSIGNCGLAVKQILNVPNPHRAKNLSLAWKLLHKACSMQDEILEFSNPAAINWFKQNLEHLTIYIEENINDGLKGLKGWEIHREEKHGLPKAPNWLSKINKDRLLLTHNIAPLNSIEECVDDLFFQSLVTSIEDDGTLQFETLANALNVVKEEYVTARYLYYYAEESKGEFQPKSKITTYANTLSYADFGLSSGFLKTSFRLSADCLDKIAGFLNIYFELGNNVDHVTFSNVWFSNLNPKKGLHPKLSHISSNNQFVRALLDMKRDWYLQSFPMGRLKDVRNKATHSKLILHQMISHQEESMEDWNSIDFRNLTFFMLRLTKSAIMYTISAVEVEENLKAESFENIPPSIRFDTGKGITDWSIEWENEED